MASLTKFEVGTALTLFFAIISGVIYLTRLETRVSLLEPDKIKEETGKAIQRISTREKEALDALKDFFDPNVHQLMPPEMPTQVARLEERLGQIENVGVSSSILAMSVPETGFGDWKLIEVDRVYQADSDGFVSAYTYTEAVAISLRTGELESELGEPSHATRSRASSHDGTIMPVKKGHYYVVSVDTGSPNFVKAYWAADRGITFHPFGRDPSIFHLLGHILMCPSRQIDFSPPSIV